MSLDAISEGASVLLDANIAIYARRAASAECQRLLGRCASREIHGYYSAIALAEFCHRRMMQEAQSLGLAGANPARALGKNIALLKELQHYRRNVEDLLASELRLLPLEAEHFHKAL